LALELVKYSPMLCRCPPKSAQGWPSMLLASLDGEPDPDAEQAWVQEITARAESVRWTDRRPRVGGS